jgi:methylenetetrahydrofolate dehydrogenase (NADP+)/methenyltetrahydrofolate cyclohydrolase
VAESLDGRNIAKAIKKRLQMRRAQWGQLTLASVKVGEDKATDFYIKAQRRWAESLDLNYKFFGLNSDVSYAKASSLVKELNQDDTINGIIIHKPLPLVLEEKGLAEQIIPEKDIEGVSPFNLGRLMLGKALLIPPTALGVIECIKQWGLNLYGKNIVIIGYTSILGKPLSALLADSFASVAITHVGTYKAGKLKNYLADADIVVAAAGKPGLVKADWLKSGAAVIDVGINKINNKIVGDVETVKTQDKVGFLTPVPGGVGPLTTAFLFSNFLKAVEIQDGKDR